MDFKQVYTNKEVYPNVVLKRLSASSLNIHERVHISDHQRFDNFKTMNDHRVLEWVWLNSPVITQQLLWVAKICFGNIYGNNFVIITVWP